MPARAEHTTLVCLFHHPDLAQATVRDLLDADIPQTAISTIDQRTADPGALATMGVPDDDVKHLSDGIRNGGAVVIASVSEEQADRVEGIFKKYSAAKIDDREVNVDADSDETGQAVIPIIAEDLQVSKRTVDAGGVRVFRRVVEIPVVESVQLRDEHVSVERHPVDRPVLDNDSAFAARSIELTETSEEAVVSKVARVVEEVVIGKQVSEHTEHIHETVRSTELDVEEIAPGGTPRAR